MLMRVLFLVLISSALAFASDHAISAPSPSRVNIRVITDEADAVLAILAKRKAKQTLTDDDWQRVFSSEGYVRLKKRETAMRRSFEESDFKTFALSDELLARVDALSKTLQAWKSANTSHSAQLALTYLPKAAHINAKIYPVIKPRQ